MACYNELMAKESIQLKRAEAVLYGFYGAATLVHVLIIATVIPYDWVGGGRVESYGAQVSQSVMSMAIIGLLALFIRTLVQHYPKLTRWQRYALYLVTIYWGLSWLLQLVGTRFEQYVMSVVVFVGLLAHLWFVRIIRSGRKQKAKA